MAQTPQFSPGDVVAHTLRPEWGEGIVDKAQLITHEGKPAQRLEIKFTHKGRVTLNTAMAPLAGKSTRKDAGQTMRNAPTLNQPNRTNRSNSDSAGGWLASLESKGTTASTSELQQLPDALSDPFLTLEQRIEAAFLDRDGQIRRLHRVVSEKHTDAEFHACLR